MATNKKTTQKWQTLKVVHEFDRPASKKRQRIVCEIGEVDEKRFIDLRTFAFNPEAQEYRPTYRGLTLPLSCAEDLKLAAAKVMEAAEALNE